MIISGIITVAVAMMLYYFSARDDAAIRISSTPFYFIRHGQTDYNAHYLIGGITDTPLNTTGITQAHNAAQNLKYSNVETIVTSPLQRASTTAEIIAQAIHKPIIIMDEFSERSVGDFEGASNAWWPIALLDGLTGKSHVEQYAHFKNRIIRGLQKALMLPGPVLIVAHGMVFEMIETILDIPHTYIENARPVFFAPYKNQNHSWYFNYLTESQHKLIAILQLFCHIKQKFPMFNRH